MGLSWLKARYLDRSTSVLLVLLLCYGKCFFGCDVRAGFGYPWREIILDWKSEAELSATQKVKCANQLAILESYQSHKVIDPAAGLADHGCVPADHVRFFPIFLQLPSLPVQSKILNSLHLQIHPSESDRQGKIILRELLPGVFCYKQCKRTS